MSVNLPQKRQLVDDQHQQSAAADSESQLAPDAQTTAADSGSGKGKEVDGNEEAIDRVDDDDDDDDDDEDDDDDDDDTAGDGQGDEMARESLSLHVTWQGAKHTLRISQYATVLSIKVLLEELTEVEVTSQKLLGLVKGRLPRDQDTLVQLGVADGMKVRLMGTRTADKLRPRGPQDNLWAGGANADELDVDYVPDNTSVVISTDHGQKLDGLVQSAEVRLMNEPRVGKKLAVLDLDYTLFDCKNVSGDIADMARPGLHEFLSAIYPYYDIVIWSQTKWYVVESKITLLGMLTHPNYRITSALDISTMFSVTAIRGGKKVVHQVKALEFIWRRLPMYNAGNTVHVDDVSRNFALNPKNGLKIHAFKRADRKPRRDRELFGLARYLVKIAQLENFDLLDHSKWKSYMD